MNKYPAITEQTRQNLIDAFWTLFCAKRIEKITVREITQKAGYNRGTFYEYFADVYDVLEQVESSLIPGAGELPPMVPVAVKPEMSLELFLKLYDRNSTYYSVLLGENGDPAFARKLKTALKPVTKSLLADKTSLDAMELDYVLEFILSSMISMLSYWFEQSKSLPADRLIALMYDLLERGVMKKLKG